MGIHVRDSYRGRSKDPRCELQVTDIVIRCAAVLHLSDTKMKM